MDSKPAPRTPQPPARADSSSSKPSRSRVASPSGAGEQTAPKASPSAAAITGARANAKAKQPSTTYNNNSSSPRPSSSTRSDEPATDDDDTSRFAEPLKDEWLRQSEVTLAALEKQVQDAAKRTLQQETRCTSMRDAIAGREERMDTLRGIYATLNHSLAELELVSNGDIDADALDELYNSIPSDARLSALE